MPAAFSAASPVSSSPSRGSRTTTEAIVGRPLTKTVRASAARPRAAASGRSAIAAPLYEVP
jgi:hypothetical protein